MNLWDVRDVAQRNILPFHAILLTVAHQACRAPDAADLRLQVYGALTYGARGLAYYKFRSRPLAVLGAPNLGNFRGAPLDEFNEKTQAWDNLRNMNHHLANLTSTLLKLRSDDVYHIGEVPERNHGVNEHNLVKSLKAGSQFIIGDFSL